VKKHDIGTKLAKNSIALYVRMLLVVFLSFLISRYSIDILGVENYGLFTLMNGTILILSFATTTLLSSFQRFFAYSLGRNDKLQLSKDILVSRFITGLFVLFVSLISLSFAEFIVSDLLEISKSQIESSKDSFKILIIFFAVNTIAIPDKALLLAFEKMYIYGALNVVESILKLTVILAMLVFDRSDITYYVTGLVFVSAVITLLYRVAAFKETSPMYQRAKLEMISVFHILSFSGWSLIGAFANIMKMQGTNIVLNKYSGIAVSSVYAISLVLTGVLTNSFGAILQASSPQLVKYSAINNGPRMLDIMCLSSKSISIIAAVLILPLMIETELFLRLWLGDFPDSLLLFVKYSLLVLIFEALAYPISNLISAKGDIKVYQLLVGGMNLITIPALIVLLNYTNSVHYIYALFALMTLLSLMLRLTVLRRVMKFSVGMYFLRVLFPTIVVITIGVIVYVTIKWLAFSAVVNVLVAIVFSLFFMPLSMYYIGLSKSEKILINRLIKKMYENIFALVNR
jgi:O-antigen/teichoic acid export membrane protein